MSTQSSPIQVPHEVVRVDPLELTDDQRSAFLEALERSGSIRGASRTIGVKRWSVRLRQYRDPQFRSAVYAGRSRRLQASADELMFSLDELRHALSCHGEVLDELVNMVTGEPLPHNHEDVDPEQLAAARERLRVARLEWARAVVRTSDVLAGERAPRDDLRVGSRCQTVSGEAGGAA